MVWQQNSLISHWWPLWSPRFEALSPLPPSRMFSLLTNVVIMGICCRCPNDFYGDIDPIWLVELKWCQSPSLQFHMLLSVEKNGLFWRVYPDLLWLQRKKDETSSFPSRAVTCAVVYSFGASYAYMYHYDTYQIQWWMPVLLVSITFLASFARVRHFLKKPSTRWNLPHMQDFTRYAESREWGGTGCIWLILFFFQINLGVHYPSDCLGGILQVCISLSICFFSVLPTTCQCMHGWRVL